MGSNNDSETDVVICGCGPTGAMLSVLLSQHGVPHVILEKEPDITVDPRGIALDEEGIRCLQACGIYDKVFTNIGKCMMKFKFVGGTKKDLSTKAFLEMTYGTTEGGTGHPGFLCHKQPHIEKHLRDRIAELNIGQLRVGCRVTSIDEDEDKVFIKYTDKDGNDNSIRAKFLIGADGKTGFTRKQYLEPKGIRMERASDMHYEEDWVAMNWKMSLPTPETHPDFPLWEKGYTPQQVYDAFFPANFRFLCNPERAAVCGRFGLDSDRLWRFEYVVLDGENSQEMATPAKMAEVVDPYITHPGSRYGIAEAQVRYPSDCIEVLRCRPFRFSARSCNKWSLDRTILCGDAAHVFPPFGGQGIASGFRDVISLAWRLRLATQGTSDHRKLLEGWYAERKQQLDASLRSTIENGAYVTESDSYKIFVRDWYLWLVQLVPAWKRWHQLGIRREGMTRYQWEAGRGMSFLPDSSGGECFPQVYATDTYGDEKVLFTDDIIFSSTKKSLFQLVVLAETPSDLIELDSAAEGLSESSHGALLSTESSIFVTDPPGNMMASKRRTIYRTATAEEFSKDPTLCAGRPKPIGYDQDWLHKAARGNQFIVLRPDRFVFAACKTVPELLGIAERIGHLVVHGQI